jgi:uncharacterized protein (TIGR03086 family)
MTVSDSIDVIEYTDPICSWAWGTEPKLRLLQWRHGHHLRWRVVMGGLVGDASGGRADWDPARAAAPMSAYWKRSSAYTGQPYPMPMHRMARSTDPAGVAVKAALEQGADVAARVLRRFREATFVFGATPETVDHFVAAAAGVPGLDVERWVTAIGSEQAATAYRADWEETRRPNDFVRNLTGDQVGIGSMKQTDGHDRYAFPTLIFRGSAGERTVAGWMPYEAYIEAMEAVSPGITADPYDDPTIAEAFERWGVLTENELRVLCGPIADDEFPSGVVAHFWGRGLVYFSSEEAAARGLPNVPPAEARSLAAFSDALELAYGLVARITEVDWSRPTPCSEWDVRALVNHMVGSAHMVTFGLLGRTITPEFYGNHLGPDPIASYRAAIDEVIGIYSADPTLLVRTLDLGWSVQRGADLAIMFTGDHLVHAWDVARSLGLPTDFDHELVRRVRAFGDDYADQWRGPGMFDPAVDPPAGANPMDCFAHYVGRGHTLS